MSARIGVLALQGGVKEHALMLQTLGVDPILVRQRKQLADLDGIVLPGGESSTIDRLLRLFDMHEYLAALLREGLPTLATCAGLISLATTVRGGVHDQQSLQVIDMVVQRNAFGPQVDSAVKHIDTVYGVVTAAFIRAPEVVAYGETVEPIAHIELAGQKRIVGVRSGNALALSFHPELTGDSTMHQEFLQLAGA